MHLINRGGRERGAVAVVVAITTVMMMGFAALAIDLSSAYSDWQQLQNGADAGALAIAESCKRGECVDRLYPQPNRTSTLAKADSYVKANKLDGVANGTPVVDWVAGKATVTATSTHTNWFASVIGFPTTSLSATATARWGSPSGGNVMPLTFSLCEFWRATGGWNSNGQAVNTGSITIHMVENQCTLPAHNSLAGGFGWLDGQNCVATVTAGVPIESKPGNTEPGACSGFNWSSLVNKTVLIPIYDEVTGNGTNGMYKIAGLAAFKITDFCFGSAAMTTTMPSNCVNDKRVVGNFTSYTRDLSGYTIDPSAPQFGVMEARLSG